MLHFWGIIASSAVRGSPVAAGGKKKQNKKNNKCLLIGPCKAQVSKELHCAGWHEQFYSQNWNLKDILVYFTKIQKTAHFSMQKMFDSVLQQEGTAIASLN